MTSPITASRRPGPGMDLGLRAEFIAAAKGGMAGANRAPSEAEELRRVLGVSPRRVRRSPLPVRLPRASPLRQEQADDDDDRDDSGNDQDLAARDRDAEDRDCEQIDLLAQVMEERGRPRW